MRFGKAFKKFKEHVKPNVTLKVSKKKHVNPRVEQPLVVKPVGFQKLRKHVVVQSDAFLGRNQSSSED